MPSVTTAFVTAVATARKKKKNKKNKKNKESENFHDAAASTHENMNFASASGFLASVRRHRVSNNSRRWLGDSETRGAYLGMHPCEPDTRFGGRPGCGPGFVDLRLAACQVPRIPDPGFWSVDCWPTD